MSSYSQNVLLASGDRIPVDISKSIYDVDVAHVTEWIDNNYTSSRWRIYVLYPDETINYEIPPEDIQLGGDYSENYQDGSRRSLSFSLNNETGKYSVNINVFWAGTRLRLDRGIELNDNTVIWFQSGIFVVSQAQDSLQPAQKTVQITAKDKFSLFEDKTGTLEMGYEVPVGSDIEKVIQDILLFSTGSGAPFDSRPIIIHSRLKGKKTQMTISKSAGDTFGSILLELATQLSAEIFYNATGNLTLIPTDEVSLDVDKPTLYSYDADHGDISGLNLSYDMSSIINRVIVVGSSLTGGVVTATAVVDDTGSPLCYQRIGYRTGSVINDSNITTQYLAEERAQYELRKQLILKTSTSLTVLFNPLLSVNNLITITSEYYGLDHAKFLIQSISCSLDYSGTMSISVSNIKNLPLI